MMETNKLAVGGIIGLGVLGLLVGLCMVLLKGEGSAVTACLVVGSNALAALAGYITGANNNHKEVKDEKVSVDTVNSAS